MTEVSLAEIGGNKITGTMEFLGTYTGVVTEDSFAVSMKVEEKHLNHAGIAHGGVLYTLCDQVVGSYDMYKKAKGVGMDGSINYYRPALPGDVITATLRPRKEGRRSGVYMVELTNQDGKLLADLIVKTMHLD